MRYADLVSERLWKPLGAEASGYITVDRIGGARAAGGKCFLARDLARVGMMMSNGGQRQGIQVIPKKWINDITHNGDPQAWIDGDFYDDMGQREMHYRSKWYIKREAEPLIFGLGIHGQFLFIFCICCSNPNISSSISTSIILFSILFAVGIALSNVITPSP